MVQKPIVNNEINYPHLLASWSRISEPSNMLSSQEGHFRILPTCERSRGIQKIGQNRATRLNPAESSGQPDTTVLAAGALKTKIASFKEGWYPSIRLVSGKCLVSCGAGLQIWENFSKISGQISWYSTNLDFPEIRMKEGDFPLFS